MFALLNTLSVGPVKIIHGPEDDVFQNLVGFSLSVVRSSLADALNIPPDADAWVNGLPVGREYRLRANDVVEFVRRWGRKRGEPQVPSLLGAGPLLTLTQAAKLIPGRQEGSRISVRTVWRWCLRGVRGGITLKSVVVGGQRLTTEQWIRDFIEALNPPGHADTQQPFPFRTPLQRQRESDRATEELKKLWMKRQT